MTEDVQEKLAEALERLTITMDKVRKIQVDRAIKELTDTPSEAFPGAGGAFPSDGPLCQG